MIVTAFSTLCELIEPNFPCELKNSLSDRAGPLGEELAYLIQWASPQDPADMNATLFSVMQHLSRTRHLITFEIADEHLENLATWGRKSNSIFALPDETLRDPDGALLAGDVKLDTEITGKADEEAAKRKAAVPIGSVPYPHDAVERAFKHRERLQKKGILITPDLPPILGLEEVEGKTEDEVAWRALALFIVAVRAESIATEQDITLDQLRAKSPMAFEAMTRSEQEFMSHPDPDPQVVVQFAWRYESLYAIQWALGMQDQMSFPDEICNVPQVAQAMVDQPDRQIVVDASLRPWEDLLDAADLNYQLLWAARQAHLDGKDPPAKIDGGVLVERQHALNWIIQLGQASWDEVDTPT